METNVSQLLQEPIGATRYRDIDASLRGIGKDELVFHGDCRLLRTRLGILVICKLDTAIEMTCSRCLETYSQPIHVAFEEEFVPTVDVISGVALNAPEDPNTFIIDSHHILDVREAVRQYTLLAIPLKPLCREDCAGLCPTCGKNLNEGPCDCPPVDIDPRWAVLKKLLK